MTNPSKRYPFAIESLIAGYWYALDAYRTREAAQEMLPVFRGRAAADWQLRIRDIREERPLNDKERAALCGEIASKL